MIVKSQVCALLAQYWKLSCSNEATNFSCNVSFLVGDGEYDLRPRTSIPFVDKHLRFDIGQSFDCGIFRLVWVYHGSLGRTSCIFLQLVGRIIFLSPGFLPCRCPWGRPFLMMYSGIERRSIAFWMNFWFYPLLFTQEVPARAIDDANVPVWWRYFAVRFGFHLEQFTQFNVFQLPVRGYQGSGDVYVNSLLHTGASRVMPISPWLWSYVVDNGKIGDKRWGRQTNSRSSSLSLFQSFEELEEFQACGAVNVETGDMFLRITQNGEFVPALVALRCADKRLFARACWTRAVVFLSLSLSALSCHLAHWLKSKSHPYCVARVRHTFLKLGSGAMGSSFREQVSHWTDPAVFTQPDQWKGFLSAMVTAHEVDLLHMRNFLEEITKNKYNQGGLTLKDLKPDTFESNEKSKLSFRQWSDEFSSWVERIDQDFEKMLRLAAQMQEWDEDKFIDEAQQ